MGLVVALLAYVHVVWIAPATTSNPTSIDSKRHQTTVDDALMQIEIALFWQNETINSSDDSGDCFCPKGRPNWIYYTNCPGVGAGIKDRQNIFRNLMWWADELCARIAIQCSPNVFLGKQHKCYAPETATWDEYFVTGRGQSGVHGWRNIEYVEGVVDYVPLLDYQDSRFDGISTIVRTNFRSIWPAKIDPPPEQPEGTMTGLEGYMKARDFLAKNKTFVWHFDVSFWHSDLNTFGHIGKKREDVVPHRSYSKECKIIDLHPTQLQIHLARILLETMDIQHVDQFVTLHMRRGDWRECDTEPETIMKYLNCSLSGDLSLFGGGSGIVDTVLAFTNADEEYKTNVTKKFQDTFPPNTSITFVDDVVESEAFHSKLLQTKLPGITQDIENHLQLALRLVEDNCFRWQVLKVLIAISKVHLERGHISCKECNKGGIHVSHPVV